MTCSLLAQNIFTFFFHVHDLFTFSQFSSKLTHDLFRTFSPPFFTTCSWLVHHLFTTWSLLVHELLELLLVKDLFSIRSLPYSWLVYDLFTTYSWLVHNFLPFFHNLFMYLQDLFTTFFFTIFSHLVHDLFRTCSFKHCFILTGSIFAHDLFTTCWWLVDSLFMTCSWFVHWLFTTFSQFFQNLFMACFDLVHYLFTKISHFFTTC